MLDWTQIKVNGGAASFWIKSTVTFTFLKLLQRAGFILKEVKSSHGDKMASRLEEDLCCPVCHGIFKHPVVLSCTHSFCKDCLKNWQREKQSRECPVCKTVCSKGKPPVSLVLKNLCEAFLLERDRKASDGLCSLHSEKLKLFCLDHQQPMCLVCRDSEKHTNHTFRPIDEAARQHKKLQDTLKSLKEKLKVFEEVKVEFEQHIQHQARRTERVRSRSSLRSFTSSLLMKRRPGWLHRGRKRSRRVRR